ncbi:MAG: thioredoxin family protein [Balneolaceae bacterium]
MSEVKTIEISRELLDSAYNYEEYRAMIEKLLSAGKTTGENHSEGMLHYTRMNIHRMNRQDKNVSLSENLKQRLEQVERPMVWLILTEAWCGDAAQLIPVIQKMADSSGKIEAKYILRDEHLELMDRFLTNGKSRSIPKLICMDAETLELLGDWGARPKEAQVLFESLSNTKGIASQEVAERLHKWYAEDKTVSMQKEFLPILDQWEKSK